MNARRSFYLTTTLPYVNAEPHIGFALEMVQADIVARYRRLVGDDVFFNTGTDEHGQKIFQKAKEEGRDVQEYVDHFAGEFKKLRGALDLSYDAFIRTTDVHHVAAAQELWRRCENAGDIYKKKYKGLYCVGDEAFVKETELVDGKCPNHPTMDLVEIEEENYFFKLSRYQDKLLTYLGTEGVVIPEWRRFEALNFVKQGLEDFSVSRVKEKMSWGIPVPGDDTQVMYVWFDALTNYVSTLGWPEDTDGNFAKFWTNGTTLQLAGKDQVRFQSIMWQAMLMSAELPTTKQVLYHGFITSGGQKMSKSVGNVIDPLAIVKEYGTDALRYFLARHVHPFEDSDFTMEKFKEIYNANLANGLGNLAARVMQLAETNLDKPVFTDKAMFVFKYSPVVEEAMRGYDLNTVTNNIWGAVSGIDEAIQKDQPFKIVKEDKKRGAEMITDLVKQLAWIAKAIEPFMPETSRKILEAVFANKKPENLFPRKE
ncbi:methionine--tRNA ligase [Candidatus Kaiserbacteria bacterium]|nr:methionine--tRNA ligase [Candidatus Kaiserbacteria bacterium]